MRSKPPRLASNPISRAFSEPLQEAYTPSLCSIDLVALPPRRDAASNSTRPSFARPSLRGVVGRGSLRCQDLLAAAAASLPREPGPQLCRLATVPRVPRNGRLLVDLDAVGLLVGDQSLRLSAGEICLPSTTTYRSEASRGCLGCQTSFPDRPRSIYRA